MRPSLPLTETTTRTLLHIENKAVNSRLLRKIMQQRKDVAMLTARYDDEVMDFIRNQQPDYIVVNLDALGINVKQVYRALVSLHEIHKGRIIVSGYDTSTIRILTSWIPRLSFIDFPLTSLSLLELLDNSKHIEAA